MSKLWGGRFKKKTHPLLEEFGGSIDLDQKLARYDVLGSIAHAQMLGACGIIPKADVVKINKGLKAILKKIEKGTFKIDPLCEDIHTHVQNELVKKVGAAGLRVHTARSRNDQVCLDVRMYCKDSINEIVNLITQFQKNMVFLANKYKKVIIPGFTHLQHAQVVSFAHHMLAYVEMVDRDKQRLLDAQKRIDICPLGSLALSGSTLPIDRKLTAKKLGFSKVSDNSLDSVSDRDFVIEMVSALSILQMHCSRLAEDFILWASQEFQLIDIDEQFCTGSSLMPQKKNPDSLELIRGATGEMYGNLVSLLVMMKSLPLSYNRDMQWDKKPLFESIETMNIILKIFALVVKNSKIQENTTLIEDESLFATDIAEYLVQKNIPFRNAHEIVGKLIRYCQENECLMKDLNEKQLKNISVAFDREVLLLLDAKNSIKKKKSIGSTGNKSIERQLAKWKKIL